MKVGSVTTTVECVIGGVLFPTFDGIYQHQKSLGLEFFLTAVVTAAALFETDGQFYIEDYNIGILNGMELHNGSKEKQPYYAIMLQKNNFSTIQDYSKQVGMWDNLKFKQDSGEQRESYMLLFERIRYCKSVIVCMPLLGTTACIFRW